MNNIPTLTCSNKKYLFNELQVEVEIESNPYQLPISQLFLMAGRINKKRSFLFVSKLLGKHIPINPNKGLVVGAILADQYAKVVMGEDMELDEGLRSALSAEEPPATLSPFISDQVNPVIIGFAETATGLGHAFYESFKKADFFHTTREKIVSFAPVISFEEEHSHATSHRCYVDDLLLQNNREIILVDDELTTGKTAINIIRSLHLKFPRKTYTVVSILDWRSIDHHKAFAALEVELGITIHCVSLLKGRIKVSGELLLDNTNEATYSESQTEQRLTMVPIYKKVPSPFSTIPVEVASDIPYPYLYETGRFGIHSKDNQKIDKWLQALTVFLKEQRTGKKTLCLGTGEFMYLPMKLASLMGDGVFYQSTTRSPIFAECDPEYGVNWKVEFVNPENLQITNYVYNIPPQAYDDLFLFFEREVPNENLQPLLAELKKTGITDIKIIFFSGREELPGSGKINSEAR